MDLFTTDQKNYLVTVDHYSDFWELDQVEDTSASTIIACCRSHFSRHGIPDTALSDNGPQFSSLEFAEFSREWEFQHQTSSPYNSQSNGKIEAAVKIAKKLLKKATRENKDPWKAILDWRNTPTESMSTSPVQRLMARRTRTLLPTANSLLKPTIATSVPEKIIVRRKKAKLYFDRSARKLPDLKSGQTVRIQTHPGTTDKKWRLGTCLRQVAPRSYLVATGGQTYRRNRKHLRPTDEPAPNPPTSDIRSDNTPASTDQTTQSTPTTDVALTPPIAKAEAAVPALIKPNQRA